MRLSIAMVAIAVLALAGCNALEGLGKDFGNAGKAFQTATTQTPANPADTAAAKTLATAAGTAATTNQTATVAPLPAPAPAAARVAQGGQDTGVPLVTATIQRCLKVEDCWWGIARGYAPTGDALNLDCKLGANAADLSPDKLQEKNMARSKHDVHGMVKMTGLVKASSLPLEVAGKTVEVNLNGADYWTMPFTVPAGTNGMVGIPRTAMGPNFAVDFVADNPLLFKYPCSGILGMKSGGPEFKKPSTIIPFVFVAE